MLSHESEQTTEEQNHTSRFICTSNHGFAAYSQEELRRLFATVKSTVLQPSEVFVATLQYSEHEVIDQLKTTPPIFLRHLFPVQYQWTAQESEQSDYMACIASFVTEHSHLQHANISLQVRKTDDSIWEDNAAALKDAIQARLDGLNGEFVVRDADYIVSVFATKQDIYVGISRPSDNISDWSGGAVRFQREEGQISRAKFKLLEAEKTFGIDFTSFREALDIGAAPGGWTSFLLDRGMKVTAVDPAKMDASVLSSPRLTYIRKNADSVKFREHQFDLLVCDMSWSPKLMARMVTNLLDAVAPGGTLIVTVKLLTKKPMALIHDVIGTFQDARLQVQRAKQLFHNRDEITIYMIKY